MIRTLLAAALLAASATAALTLPTAALAQSAADDSDLFPEDEQLLRFGSPDTNIVLSPFVQLDAGITEISPEPAPDGSDAKVRLARLYAFVNAGPFGATYAQNFHDTEFETAYAFIYYDISSAFTVKLGQQDEPFSLQDLSGSRFLPFAEAGQSASLIPGDNVGAALFHYGDQFSVAGGVFGGDVNTGVGDEGLAFSGRITVSPFYEEGRITRGGDATKNGVGTSRVERLVHFGAGVSARYDIDQDFSFSGDGSSSLVEPALASTQTFSQADALIRVNAEFAFAEGSLGIQGELTGVYVDGVTDGRPVTGFGHGGYLYATYFLTGERRSYSPSSGTFGRVVPESAVDDGGFGAIEIGARVDYLDLTDLGPEAGTQLGTSLLVNNYLTKRFLLTGDYSYTRLLDGPDEGTDVHAVTLRLQFAY